MDSNIKLLEGEVFLLIEKFNGEYSISNFGRVRSERRFKYTRWYGGIISKQRTDKDGYCIASLVYNNTRNYEKVHRLVATAFIPNPDNLPQVNHKKGIKTDNRASELEWCTGLQNMDHAIATGLKKVNGDENPKAKLTEQQVIEILALVKKGGLSKAELGRRYGVSYVTISYYEKYQGYKNKKLCTQED